LPKIPLLFTKITGENANQIQQQGTSLTGFAAFDDAIPRLVGSHETM
jgi:hypothetical protein